MVALYSLFYDNNEFQKGEKRKLLAHGDKFFEPVANGNSRVKSALVVSHLNSNSEALNHLIYAIANAKEADNLFIVTRSDKFKLHLLAVLVTAEYIEVKLEVQTLNLFSALT